MTRTTAAAAMTFLALTGSALAQPSMSSHLSPTFLACYQRAGANTVQRSVCAEREVGAQDDRLNKAYQQVMHQLAGDPRRPRQAARRGAQLDPRARLHLQDQRRHRRQRLRGGEDRRACGRPRKPCPLLKRRAP